MNSAPHKPKLLRLTFVTILTTLLCTGASNSFGQEVWEFEYTGQDQAIELPAGIYKLEVWGAQGGEGHPDATGGRGGYSTGVITFSDARTINVYVGESGESTGEGAYNGGGAAGSNYGAEGGGATDIRVYPFDLENRIIVAGGGGGATFGTFPASGGAGGGTSGGVGISADGFTGGQGGNQTTGGEAGCCYNNTAAGSFGEGASAGSYHNAGGGGGWFGGGSGAAHGGAGGGSGYITGLDETEMIAGDLSMPAPAGGTMVGKSNHGFARITALFTVILTNSAEATCPESADGFLTVEATGGVAPYTYEWSNGETGESAINLEPGEYTVTVTDANGQETSGTYEIGPEPIEVSFDMTQSSSCDENGDGALSANVTGGTTPYSYQWSSGETGHSISNKTFGDYSVTVIDANGCGPLERSESITPFDTIAPNAIAKNTTVYLDQDGLAHVEIDDINDGSYDNCAIAEMYISNPDLNCSSLSLSSGLSATLVLIDYAGNESAAEANINLVDTIKPSLNINSIELELNDEGNAILTEEMLLPYSFDNCSISGLSIQNGQFNCSHIGTTQFAEVSMSDNYGNTKQQTLEVVLIDHYAPRVSVENVTIELGENGVTELSPDLLDLSIADNCEGAEIAFSQREFSCGDLGITPVSIVVTDASGNTDEAEFLVNIIDIFSPVIEGPQIIQFCEGDPINYDLITVTDNCYAELHLIEGPQTGDTPAAGDFIVELEAADLSGNRSSKLILLSVSPPAKVDLGDDMEVEEGSTVTLIAGKNNANNYRWSDGSTGNSYRFVATEDVTVSVQVTTPEGCSASDEITILNTPEADIEDDENIMGFFPNPTRGEVFTSLTLSEDATNIHIAILDMSGKRIARKFLQVAEAGDLISLDLSSFNDGVYLVNLRSDKINLTERIVKH